MADKPTSVPRWADVGGDIVEPVAGKKNVGWAAEERPPNSYTNWLLNLIYQWCNWFFVGNLGRADLTDSTPVLSFCDQDGRDRLYVDSSGYFGGAAINEQYVVYPGEGVGVGAGAGVEICPGLDSDADANVTLQGIIPNATSKCAFTRISIGDAAVNQGGQVYSQGDLRIMMGLDDIVAVFEVRLLLDQVGANGVDVHFGFHEDSNTGADPEGAGFFYAMFDKESADTNWQMNVCDGAAATKTDTGTPPVVDVFQNFRIEYHGLLTPVGVDAGTGVVRFFIDGVLEGEIANANVPISADSAYFNIGVRAKANGVGPVGNMHVDYLPIRCSWNQMLTWTPPT